MADIKFSLDGRAGVFPTGTTYLEMARALHADRPRPALAVQCGGSVRALRDAPTGDGAARIIDYRDDEGRRVYERSARLLFLAAAKEECPDAKVWIEHSVHYGVFARLSSPVDAYTVARIERRMREHVDMDTPFLREVWDADRLLEMLREQDDDAAYRLLATHPIGAAPVYMLGAEPPSNKYRAFLFGELAASAGALQLDADGGSAVDAREQMRSFLTPPRARSFALRAYSFGVVIQLPPGRGAVTPIHWREQPKYMRTFKEAARWAKILNCRCIADLNDMVHSGSIRDFVWVSEALHEKSIAEIADRIVSRDARAALVAGPSSSGKTTFTHRLAIQLRVIGKRPVILSLDNYYKNREDIPLEADGSRDLESLSALNTDLLNSQLVDLIAGKPTAIPQYDFSRGRSCAGPIVRLDDDQPLLIEGIHGLNPEIAASLPPEMRYRIYISALTALNLDPHNRLRTTDTRLIRRIVRDHQFRSSPIEHTLSMWASVRRGEETWIFPYQESADISFNSALPYELTVLKRCASPLLAEVGEDSPNHPTATRLANLLSYIDESDVDADIAPTSILREFIGGCAFYAKSKRADDVD
ncbi:MAG: nucleoside kinase [Oscillospiraceae bacterium]|jgi:uridine kinase|nr:nucleoside kinase [Oscillospiraceae bacterium]